jgi:DNA-binding NarL/FixJ family response regulator
MRRRETDDPGSDTPATAPRGLRAHRVRAGSEALCVFSYPLATPRFAKQLSPAEREVMRLALAGCDNRAIAAARGVAPRTVANQMASIFRKLGIGSRIELARGGPAALAASDRGARALTIPAAAR